MKKLIGLMVLALFAVLMAAGGAAVTAPTSVGGFYTTCPTGYFGTPAKTSQDTMTAIDSTTLCDKVAIPQNAARMVLAISDSLGASDSIKIRYTVWDKYGTRILAQGNVDTITASNSYATFKLPFNSTVYGNFFSLKAFQLSAASGILSFIKFWGVYSQVPYTFMSSQIQLQ
jgi:hypothetical protein